MLVDVVPTCWIRLIKYYHPTKCSNGSNVLHSTMLDDVEPTCWIRLINHHHPTRCSDGFNVFHSTMLDDIGPTCWIRLIDHQPTKCLNGSNVGSRWTNMLNPFDQPSSSNKVFKRIQHAVQQCWISDVVPICWIRFIGP